MALTFATTTTCCFTHETEKKYEKFSESVELFRSTAFVYALNSVNKFIAIFIFCFPNAIKFNLMKSKGNILFNSRSKNVMQFVILMPLAFRLLVKLNGSMRWECEYKRQKWRVSYDEITVFLSGYNKCCCYDKRCIENNAFSCFALFFSLFQMVLFSTFFFVHLLFIESVGIILFHFSFEYDIPIPPFGVIKISNRKSRNDKYTMTIRVCRTVRTSHRCGNKVKLFCLMFIAH